MFRIVTDKMTNYYKEAYNQLYAITKTKASTEKVSKMLKYYFEEQAAHMEHKYKYV